MGFTRTRSMSQTTGTGGGGDRAPRIDEIVEIFKPKPNKFYTLRLVGPTFSYGAHWFEVNKKDGGQAKFTKECLAWNDEIEAMDSDRPCPYCDIDPKGRPSVHYYQNVIVRDLQEKAPSDTSVTKAERKSGFKDKDSDSWTPVRVLRIPPSSAANLREMAELNKHGKKGSKEPVAIEDEDNGCDVIYKYKPEETGGAKHQFQKGDHSPLTDEEREYLLWNTENMVTPDELKTAKDEAKRIKPRLTEQPEEEEEAEDEDYPSKDKKKGGKKGSKAKEPNFDDDDEDEEDDPPKKPKGKGSKAKAKDDDDDEDEDEDDDPPKKPKGKSSSKKSKFDDDDDDDEDEDEEDDPPKKSKKKFTPEVGDRVKATDDDDEEFIGKVTNIKGDLVSVKDSDGETRRFNLKSDTIEPLPAKKGSKSKDEDEDDDDPPKKPKGKSSSKKSNDDDDDDDDDEDDEDEEDDPPKKPNGKSSKFDDDDDDEDD